MSDLPPRRWNGWGDPAIGYPIPADGHTFLVETLDSGAAVEDASRENVLAAVPPTRLPSEPGIEIGGDERLAHARGQSLPDWIALRYGRIGLFPDGVAYPESDGDVRALLDLAARLDARLIPYGGGTSVVGHINPTAGDRPVLTVDLSRMHRLLVLDEVSRLATFEAGASGPQVETQLAARGFTLGHFPQSFEYSTVGGWIATRSTGQQSRYYGRIEDLFAGGHLETPVGALDLPPIPASAAGPDVRHFVLGSEGRLGILTRAVVRVRRRPTSERFGGVFYRDWQDGVDAVRRSVQAGLPVSMLRLSDPVETEMTLRLSGRPALVRWAARGLDLLRFGEGRCLLVLGVTDRRVGPTALGGLPVGGAVGKLWRRARFRAPYLRNSLWEAGYALDTVETAVPWSAVVSCARAMTQELAGGLNGGERVLAFSHLSHVYPDGASIYVTYIFRRTPDPDEMIERWRALKDAATRAVLSHGGTISHQHGVGTDHIAYLANEKGAAGMAALTGMCRAFDPEGRMNPGKLLS